MKQNAKNIIIFSTLIIVGLFFFFWGLVKAKGFLAPISVAALLAMVVLPVCRWFEKKKLNRGWSSLFSDLIIMLFFVLLAGVLALQVKSFMEDWPKIQKRLAPKIEQLQEFIAKNTGLSIPEQEKKISETIPGDLFEGQSSGSGNPGQGQQGTESQAQEQGKGKEQGQQQPTSQEKQADGSQSQGVSSSSVASTAGNFLFKFFSSLGTFLLILVYIFFFLLYRKKFKNSILKLVPSEKREVASKVIADSMVIAQDYLLGRLILIFFLAVLYSVGLSVSGVKNAILISILAAVLSLIPYIGNMIGFVLAIAMAAFSGSGFTGIIGVTLTFAIAQFVESYILEPYIVGDKVNLNPVMTIIVVVLGGAVWGVVGMLVAIPALGIFKVIFDHIKVLEPIGYLFGDEDIGDDNEDKDKDNFLQKTKNWAMQKFN